MSTVDNKNVWSALSKDVDSKYEKCLNITEEIYKRINITFQIKKLEAVQSDISEQSNKFPITSDQIDSNELSNETDLFACDKSDSIPSSTDEKPAATCEKYINNNNNEQLNKKQPLVYKRPRKRFRKRVKKRQSKHQSDSDGSSDEAPLSRIVELDTKCPDEWGSGVMGVPKIIIVTKDLKPKILSPDKKSTKSPSKSALNDPIPSPKNKESKVKETIDKPDSKEVKTIEGATVAKEKEKVNLESKNCTMCSLSFRGERGLRRHMTMSHIIADDPKPRSRAEQREVKPA